VQPLSEKYGGIQISKFGAVEDEAATNRSGFKFPDVLATIADEQQRYKLNRGYSQWT